MAPSDKDAWVRMRVALWPEGSAAEHDEEAERFLRGGSQEPLAVLVAEDAHGGLVGFAEISIRPYAEGCVTDRVGYLEGWFVEPAIRRRGVGRALVADAENWARSQGCSEFASDTEADNHASALAHRALGFAEAGLIRCFHKDLSAAPDEVVSPAGSVRDVYLRFLEGAIPFEQAVLLLRQQGQAWKAERGSLNLDQLPEEQRQKASELFDASIQPTLTAFVAGNLTPEAATQELGPLIRPLGVFALNFCVPSHADAAQTAARLGELLDKLVALDERFG